MTGQCGIAAASGHETELFDKPSAFSIRVPDETVNEPYAANETRANWTIAAWHIPTGQLSAFSKVESASTAIFRSNSGPNSVQIYTTDGQFSGISIHQSGKGLPCKLENGKPREFDFFLHPNSKDNAFERNAFTTAAKDAKLSDMDGLFLHADVSATYNDTDPSQDCEVNQGSVLLAVVLVNRTAKQTLFYQLALMEVCGAGKKPHDLSCRIKRANPRTTIFSQRSPFGIDDKLPALEQPFLLPGERRRVDIDVLPQIKKVVNSGLKGLDPDLGHWKVNGMTAGQNIWGNIDLQTRWNSMGARTRLR